MTNEHQEALPATPQEPDVPLWLQLLRAEVSAAGKGGVTKVAGRLGVGRSYVSQALHGLRPGGMPKSFTDRVIQRFHRVTCPARMDLEVERRECYRGNAKAPTHNPLELRVWKVCQTCPNKPEANNADQ